MLFYVQTIISQSLRLFSYNFMQLRCKAVVRRGSKLGNPHTLLDSNDCTLKQEPSLGFWIPLPSESLMQIETEHPLVVWLCSCSSQVNRVVSKDKSHTFQQYVHGQVAC